ncbi:MAG: hypothetical protein NVS3B25_21380 [Hymenobacter sp.]
MESVTAADGLDLAYNVDGKEVKLAFDNKNPAFKQAMIDPIGWLNQQLRPDGNPAHTNYDRLAEIVAMATQADVLVKNAYAAGKASLGAVIPLDRAVNPVPATPAGPSAEPTSLAEAFRQAASRNAPRLTQY